MKPFALRRMLSCMLLPSKLGSSLAVSSWEGRSTIRLGVTYLTTAVHGDPFSENIPGNAPSGYLWEGSSYETLLRKFELALQDNSAEEVWESFSNLRKLHGLPEQKHLVNKMIIVLSYSACRNWLRKAYDLALVILEYKPHQLTRESLSSLCLTLARAQLAIPASTILRIILERRNFPLQDVWNTFFLYLVKTQIGSYLASEILIETCEYLSDKRNSTKVNLKKPNVTIFNLVLDSCVRFRSTMKAKQIVELMPLMGVVADANTIVILAKIYEMNGELDYLKRLKPQIVCVSSMLLHRHYQQFYASLLSLYFKYNDIDGAAELMLDLYRLQKDNLSPLKDRCPHNQSFLQIGSSNLKTGRKIIFDTNYFENNFSIGALLSSGLVISVDGKLAPSNEAIAKLVNGYVKDGNVGKLSGFLINIMRETDCKATSLCSDVLNACIMLSWLGTAHDILDDLELANVHVEAHVYISLLRAYCKWNKRDEVKILLKQIAKAGFTDNISNVLSKFKLAIEDSAFGAPNLSTSAADEKSDIFKYLDTENRDYKLGNQQLYQFNSSIMFFCRAKMMEDALKTLKRMKQKDVSPNLMTFSYLVNGYSELGMYREITILWGEVKRIIEDGGLDLERDFLDLLLWNFLRGGYFERVMDMINYMLQHNMYIDKWKYRREFLKFHKNLYRRIKASDCSTDAQRRRVEYVRAFRKWVGIDS